MLPKEFLSRMERILGDSYPEFLAALSKEANVHGIRRNAEKIEHETLSSALEGHITPLSYYSDGFISDIEKIGHHPLHHAGAIYAQDPGAMAPLSAVAIKRGWWVADLCAAPGGKSTQIAAAVGDEGFVLSNEISASRVKALVSNIERMGVRNVLVTNTDTKTLSCSYGSVFDLVVADAPCSGEGMFRKYDYAQTEWSEELIPVCAARQKEILDNAAPMVKPGGYLLYSTCTFSVEENEENVDAFLSRHPEFTVLSVPDTLCAVTDEGIAFDGARHPEALKKARRFYPHRSRGEGQFMCLMQKSVEDDRACMPRKPYEAMEALTREETKLAERLLSDTLEAPLEELLPDHILKKHRDMLYLVGKNWSYPTHGAYRCGVAVGTFQKGRIEPHHQYFSALGRFFKRRIDLSLDDPLLGAYLHGETIPTKVVGGYAVVSVCGAPIGGVKCSDGVAKNHYPKGLRTL